jgi:hypothetical protein
MTLRSRAIWRAFDRLVVRLGPRRCHYCGRRYEHVAPSGDVLCRQCWYAS